MPGNDLLLDDTGDYVLGDDGDFETTPTAQPAVRHQILDFLGQWVGDPSAGREIRALLARQNSEQDRIEVEDTYIKALEVLEREGLITDIGTEVDRDGVGRFFIRAVSRDIQAGGTIAVESLTEFGA